MRVRDHKKQDGVTKEAVLALHAQHPDWNAASIARELKCVSGYVRATLKRAGKKNAGTRPPVKKRSFRPAAMAAVDAARMPSFTTTPAPREQHSPWWNRD